MTIDGVKSMNPNFAVIKPIGILDGTQKDSLIDEVSAAVKAGVSNVLVDFGDVSFMDSSGLGALVGALKSARASGGNLYVCSVNEQIRILFELTSANRFFQVFHDQDDFNQKMVTQATA